jgi:hypothetical protein
LIEVGVPLIEPVNVLKVRPDGREGFIEYDVTSSDIVGLINTF